MEKTITLMSGNTLQLDIRHDGHQPNPKSFEDNTLSNFDLDLSGRCLTLGRKTTLQDHKNIFSWAKTQYNNRLFAENAWFLLEHADEILSSSRMMMTPVHVNNGMAYTGTSGFAYPTVGTYLEWWLHYPDLSRDCEGNLIWFISGSPLTGANSCSSVTHDGEILGSHGSCSFLSIAKSFIEVNNRYAEEKKYADSYTLEELLVILHGPDYRMKLVELKHTAIEEALVNSCLQLKNKCRQKENKYEWLLKSNRQMILSSNSEEIKIFTKEYIDLEKELNLIPDRKSQAYRDKRYSLSVFGQEFLKKITGKNPNSITLQMIVNFGRKLLKRDIERNPSKNH